MEFEPLRDRLLVAAGRLDDQIGGRSVMIHQDATRRGLYAYIDREDLPGLLASFDLPSPDASQAKRIADDRATTSPLPDEFGLRHSAGQGIGSAQATGRHESDETDKPSTQQIDCKAMRRSGFGGSIAWHSLATLTLKSCRRRSTSSIHHRSSRTVWRRQRNIDPGDAAHHDHGDSLDPWVQLAQVLLLCNEFAFVD